SARRRSIGGLSRHVFENASVHREGTRPTRLMVIPLGSQRITRKVRLDLRGQVPTSSRDPVRRRTSTHVDGRSMSAMLQPEPVVDAPAATAGDATSLTLLLADLRAGRREAFDQILPLVYHELRRAARRELAARPSDSLSATALVHELYLKFSRTERADWRNRAHFLSVAAVAMRHILVDRARRRSATKRGGPQRQVTLEDDLTSTESKAE